MTSSDGRYACAWLKVSVSLHSSSGRHGDPCAQSSLSQMTSAPLMLSRSTSLHRRSPQTPGVRRHSSMPHTLRNLSHVRSGFTLGKAGE